MMTLTCRSPALRALQLACLLALISPQVRAETARARIAVSVTVIRPATVQSASLPSELEISGADIRRGYVEWRPATQLTVGNNNPVGFVLDVLPTARIFSQVEISASGERRATLGADGGRIVGWRGSGAGDPLLLTFRFKLQPDIAPGRYPWPLRVDARLDY